MKTIVAIGLMALFLFVFAVEWSSYHLSAVPASASASQIYIHGTPVCVFRHGESIVARIGECDLGAGRGDDAPDGRIPDEGTPGMGLPPGHPPVGPEMFPEGGERRIPI